MEIIDQHTAPLNINNEWIISYTCKTFDEFPTHSSVKKAIKKGLILVDGKKPNWNALIKAGMKIEILEDEIIVNSRIHIDMDIIYEDEELAIVNKPAGIEVSGNKTFTVQNKLINIITRSKNKDYLPNPRPVHRLDYATSGLLIIAKTRSARANLGKQFEKREVTKTYTALVTGYLEGKARITKPIDQKEAISEYEVISNSKSIKTDWLTKVILSPKTGRTHQLRIHMSMIGHDIVGDKIYGKKPILKGKGMFLCATGLSFRHPSSNLELKFTIDAPNKFENFIKTQQKNWKNHNFGLNI